MHSSPWGIDGARTPPSSTTQQAVEGIKRFIRDNSLSPGDTMPTEAELCAELGFSRSSVREAMRTLATLDIVEVRHGTGTFVSNASLTSLVQGLIFRATLDADENLETLRYVVETRQAMDLAIGREIARKLDTPTYEQLQALVTAMGEKQANAENFADEDRRFHHILLSNIDNLIIRELYDALWQVHMNVIPLRQIQAPRDLIKTVQAHQDIINALRDNNLDAYKAAVYLHYEPILESL
ncbi:GntR family transcriptional regulator [Corynebacterium macginleyi]|uniref:FadR/GntR family transcriptional regulator n=1 Tax=Corynebacterium macginleyi TaxID=38290 RepID=UPI00190A5B6C|nr:FadR/GntR family transcriptional regulator [Corynebacterium macginleyi]MBK4145968.1 GntR family transcriptional regulator [Corynebacterium macginleyi]